ncbi:hypothetical protein [Glaciecola sp. SC05]|uniref:hypothetical protein n=1 Tax=Glaciecola sp. SC05 TaxID=1987355 RepID=UPI003529A1C3
MNSLALSSKSMRNGAQLAYWAGGSLIILLALLSFFTQMTLADLLSHIERLFGVTFVVCFSALVAVALWSVHKIYLRHNTGLWSEVGLQAANGISTLALTFTLLGISLGIGSLANQPLTPDTVQAIIGQLTAQFSMAFMTTVVGLPTATLFRAIISIQCVKQQAQAELQAQQ